MSRNDDFFPSAGDGASGHGSADGPSGARPCHRFSEEIHLLVDRELGEAETQMVEAHIQQCARCLGLATHLEHMSSALKAWDERENDVAAPELRLRHAVLARVEESSQRRRRDDRFVRVLHFATAAVVVLGLGLGITLGLGVGADAPAAEPVFEISTAPSPLSNRERPPLDLPTGPFEDRITARDLTAGVRVPDYDSPTERDDPRKQLVTDEHMKLFAGGDDETLALLQARAARLAAFESRVGEPAMYWNGPYAGSVDQRIVPERIYRWLQQQKLLKTWRDSATQTSTTVAVGTLGSSGSAVGERDPSGAATGVLAKDMLRPMQGITHPLRLDPRERLAYVSGLVAPAPGSTKSKSAKTSQRLPLQLEAYAIKDPVGAIPGLRSGPLGQPNRAFLDPIEAWGNKQLYFGETQHGAGMIVAYVTNTKRPIFIPAGQFITDGHGDRVVSHPTWLPASTGKGPQAHIIHCHVVQGMPFVKPRGVPQLSAHIVGPTIRALLASGATQAQVKAASKAIIQAAKARLGQEFHEWTWSLRSFYVRNAEANAAAHARVRWKGTHGFLATDAQGRFLGFELVRISGGPAERLLSRLWLSYVVEAIWRSQSPALAEAFAAPSDGAARVLGRLASHPAGFRLPVNGASGTDESRVSTLDLQASGVQVHALEVGGRSAIVSGLSSAK